MSRASAGRATMRMAAQITLSGVAQEAALATRLPPISADTVRQVADGADHGA